jgi:hypothetical protein
MVERRNCLHSRPLGMPERTLLQRHPVTVRSQAEKREVNVRIPQLRRGSPPGQNLVKRG